MATFDEAYREWEGLMLSKQAATLLRRGMLGDGNDVVNVPGRPGWSWIRYSEEQSKLSQVRNVLFGYAADGTPVVVGKAHADDDYEQVLRVDWAPYMQHLTPDRISQYAVAPHGDTHHGTHGNDPAYIDLNNIVVGKVIPTDPVSLSVYVEAFVYAYGTDLETFPGGPIDLTVSVPGAGLHRYVLVYLTMATGALGSTDGVTVPLPADAEIPDASNSTIPLGVVELEAGQTEIDNNIWQYKLLWCGIGYTGIHTHTDDASGGSSIIDLEELIFECAEPLFLMGNAIWPVNTYHSLYIESMYISGLVAEADLTWIHADPIHGCGQVLIIRPSAPDMYTSYKINVRHGVGNIYLMGETDITLDERTDHLTLIYDGESWCEILPTWGHDGNGWVSSMDVRLDDGAGDSPELQFIPQVGDVWAIFAENSGAGDSDLVVLMPADHADVRFIWRDSLTPANVAWVSAAGNAFFSTATATNSILTIRTTDDDNTHPLVLVQKANGTELTRIDSNDLTNLFMGYGSGRLSVVTGIGTNQGSYNTMIGQYAGRSLTSGDRNTGLGYSALLLISTGQRNVAIGTALYGLTTGSRNFGLGFNALGVLVSGNDNIAIGNFALVLVTGSDNIGIGSAAGQAITNGQRNVMIGFEAGKAAIGNVSDTLIIHNSDTATPLILGDFTAGLTIRSQAAAATALTVVGAGAGADRLFHVVVADAVTNAVTIAQRLSHVSSGVVVAGFGTGIEFGLEENNGTNRIAAILEVKWSDAGEGVNADAYFDFKTMLNDGAAVSVMVVGYNGNVGIRTPGPPDGTLHVHTASAGAVTADPLADDLVVENDSNAGISILAPDGTSSSLYLGKQSDRNIGGIYHDHDDNYLGFLVGGNVAGYWTVTGLGIVSSAPDGMLHVGDQATNYFSVGPTGDTKWVGGGGLVFGGCYGNHIGWLQANAVQNTWYNVSDADMTDAQLHNVTHDGSGKLTVTEPGRYLIIYSICFEDNVANDHIEAGIEINGSGTAEPQGQTHVENKFANEEEHLGDGNTFDLADNSTIEVCIRTTDAGNPDISVQGINLAVVMVGGT